MLLNLLRNLQRSSIIISPVSGRYLALSATSRDAHPKEQQRDSVNCDVPDHFTFYEEPLGLPASEGFGYFQGGPGFKLGPNSRFEIQAKLGFGATSSVWLARDGIDNTHVAIKILTGDATRLNFEHKLRELEVLQRISTRDHKEASRHLACLRTHFVQPEIFADDGEHLCLVMELSSSSVQDFQQALWSQTKFVPLPTVKHILKQLLRGITHLHRHGIAHTDIKPDNLMIGLGSRWTTKAIDTWISRNPPRTYAPQRSLNKMVSGFVSQSLPPPTVEELASCELKLADFSSAQFVSDQTTDEITPLGLRAPEVVLGGEWDQSVDIWTFGCMVFTLLTNRPLFKPMVSAEHNASEVDVLIYQMIIFCGEFFQPDLLRRCRHSIEYFDLTCRPRKFKSFVRKPFDECISSSGRILNLEDMAGATDLMTKCLRLDPKDRASAEDLLQHPWLNI